MQGMGMSEERMKALYESFTQGGRDLDELRRTDDKLKGAEAQRLRTDFTAQSLDATQCDNFFLVAALMVGSLEKLREMWKEEVAKCGGGTEGTKKAVTKWYEYRDGHNKLPIYDILLIGAFTESINTKKETIPSKYFDCLKFLISLGISVEGTDVAGFTAFHHSVVLTPFFVDLAFSQILLDASDDTIAAINHKNRYGDTCVHDLMMSYRRPGETELRAKVLRWLLERGVNSDVIDNDTTTPRAMTRLTPEFSSIMREFDDLNAKEKGCAFCRRGGQKGKGKGAESDAAPVGEGEIRAALRCGNCRNVLYCGPKCQRYDWQHHKKSCRPTKKA